MAAPSHFQVHITKEPATSLSATHRPTAPDYPHNYKLWKWAPAVAFISVRAGYVCCRLVPLCATSETSRGETQDGSSTRELTREKERAQRPAAPSSTAPHLKGSNPRPPAATEAGFPCALHSTSKVSPCSELYSFTGVETVAVIFVGRKTS